VGHFARECPKIEKDDKVKIEKEEKGKTGGCE
jgi:hypothetical protein